MSNSIRINRKQETEMRDRMSNIIELMRKINEQEAKFIGTPQEARDDGLLQGTTRPSLVSVGS